MKSSFPGILFLCVIVSVLIASPAATQERSIRFYGNGYNAPDSDRIKIPLTNQSAVNVGDDFTIECWLKCVSAENNGTVSEADHGDGWITGNIFFDRDVYGSPDSGDFGLAIGTAPGLPASDRVVAFGINRADAGLTIRGTINIADNKWHHVAVTRESQSGKMRIYIDGVPDGVGRGPAGPIQYNVGRNTSYPNSDPFIVLGAEKHNAGGAYPAYSGFMDELRISTSIRYTTAFVPSMKIFQTDAATAGLYHFNEGAGTAIKDASAEGSGPSPGEVHTGGSPVGPIWLSESPFRNAPLKWMEANAKKESRRILLNWNTEPSSSYSMFEIQRSPDGVRYTSIGQQERRESCNGNCQYTYADTHPLEGKNYYRVKNTSLSGEITYSSTMQVLFTQKINPYKIYQNGNSLVVRNSSTIESLVIWNSEGKRLLEKKNIREGVTQVPLQQAKGFAFVHINLEDGTRFTEKIMLQ